MLIDFNKLNHSLLHTTMDDIGVTDFNNLSLLAILKRLNLGSERSVEEKPPKKQQGSKVNLSEKVQILRQEKKIIDTIGSVKIFSDTDIYFSTLVGIRPKEYLKQYVEVAKTLCEPSSALQFTILLEDSLTPLKNDWDLLTLKKSINLYKAFFQKMFPGSRILLSSEIAPIGVPKNFAEKLTTVATKDFLSLLPFHLQNPMFVKILDIVHCVWNCYLLYRSPGIHLVGVNNKRHFQLFRKIVESKLTVVLLPLGSESSLT